MTTENVTVLFTDMVESTALTSTLAPNVADELRRAHFAILRQAVAEAGGTEVKHLGDGLMVVFGAPSAALTCAVGMQQGVDRDNRGRERPVGLRVGLSGGEVSREDDDYFGDPVVEASRLCARCESGQVLAADIVRLTAGRRSRHQCRSLGELTLKGLPDPVETVEVVWQPPRPRGARRASQTSEDGLLDMLDAASAAALVRELTDTPGHYNFAHALIQHTRAVPVPRTHPAGPGAPASRGTPRSPVRRPARRTGRRTGPPLINAPN